MRKGFSLIICVALCCAIFNSCKPGDSSSTSGTGSAAASAPGAATVVSQGESSQAATAEKTFEVRIREWVDKYASFPCGAKGGPAAAECRRKALALHKQAYRLYKQKKDAEAVVLYEKAMQMHPTAGLCYDYANSLSNIPRLEDAMAAYSEALRLRHPKYYLVYYNMACAASRMRTPQKAELAFRYLQLAVENGYNAINYIARDPDLAYLRAQPEWKNRYQKALQKVQARMARKRKEEYQLYLAKQRDARMKSKYYQNEKPGFEAAYFRKWYQGKQLVDQGWKTLVTTDVTYSPKQAGKNLVITFMPNGQYLIQHHETGHYKIKGNIITLENVFGNYYGVARKILFTPYDENSLYLNGVLFKVTGPVSAKDRQFLANFK